MSLDYILTRDRRLVVLQALHAANGYQLYDRVLLLTIEGGTAAVSLDRLRTDLDWLAEQGLIGVERHDGPWLARIEARGVDVALGRTTVPGVERPLPGGY